MEIDESKLAKRKFNKGHRVDGIWVIGGMERTVDRKISVCIVEDRSAETINGYYRLSCSEEYNDSNRLLERI